MSTSTTAHESRRPYREDAQVALVPLERLRFHPRNIRSDLGDLTELTASIAAEGVLVPVMAERLESRHLRLLHGHRRWAAAKLAGVTRLPTVIVDQHTDDQAIFLMLAENTRRAKVSKLDLAKAIATLRGEFGLPVSAIARRLGVSVPTIYNWQHPDGAGDAELAARHVPSRNRSQITARLVHGLLRRHAAGDLAADEVVERLREQLNGWAPPTDRALTAEVTP